MTVILMFSLGLVYMSVICHNYEMPIFFIEKYEIAQVLYDVGLCCTNFEVVHLFYLLISFVIQPVFDLGLKQ